MNATAKSRMAPTVKEIARQMLRIETATEDDLLDYHDLPASRILGALEAAYQAGYAARQGETVC